MEKEHLDQLPTTFVSSKLKDKYIKKETPNGVSKITAPKQVIKIFLAFRQRTQQNGPIKVDIFLESLSKVLTLPWITGQTKNLNFFETSIFHMHEKTDSLTERD